MALHKGIKGTALQRRGGAPSPQEQVQQANLKNQFSAQQQSARQTPSSSAQQTGRGAALGLLSEKLQQGLVKKKKKMQQSQQLQQGGLSQQAIGQQGMGDSPNQ